MALRLSLTFELPTPILRLPPSSPPLMALFFSPQTRVSAFIRFYCEQIAVIRNCWDGPRPAFDDDCAGKKQSGGLEIMGNSNGG